MSERAVSFGYKTGWLAVPGREPETVAAAIGLTRSTAATWEVGVERAYEGDVFVSPQIAGWNLVVSRALLDASMSPRWREWLERLSGTLTEVQYFGTHRVVEYHAWWRARQGRLVRAFAFLGESGEVLANLGAQTPEEAELGLPYPNPEAPTDDFWEQTDPVMPNEKHVMALAAKWSIDPTGLDEFQSTGTGLLGSLDPIV